MTFLVIVEEFFIFELPSSELGVYDSFQQTQ